MKTNRIAVIGHFGGHENILDGQTIKTKILYAELEGAAERELVPVDTYFRNKHPVRLLIRSLYCLLTTKDVIVLLSGNGMRFYFPILYYFSRILHTRVYHDVIGGNLDTYIDRYPAFRRYLNAFRVNWVETNDLKVRLEQKGLTNCVLLPNFKRLPRLRAQEIETRFTEPYRFVFFARVTEEKGVETAINAIETINRNAEKQLCALDIYGRIDEPYRNRFEAVMARSTPAIRYCGTVPYDQSVETLRRYYALLFPTHWNGEGFPGTMIDAFAAGLPIIASDWGSNAEIVNRDVGIIYPSESHPTLESAVESLLASSDEVKKMRLRCLEEAEKYMPEPNIKIILEALGTP